MKYMNMRFFLVALAATVAFAGCKKDFLDVNTDPNRVNETSITPELIFPQALNAVGARNASANFRFLDNYLGYYSTSGSFAPDAQEIAYNLDFTFSEGLFQGHYNILFDLYQVKTRAVAKGDTVLAGAAMILSAKLWQELVDMFGDIPYSQAFQISQFSQPKYDKAKDIYVSLQKSLDTAVSYMRHPQRATFAKLDIATGGNQTKWIKLANTLRLRLLIRQSEVIGATPTADLAKITADGGVLHAGESFNVNPGYSNEANKQSPYYAGYGLTPTGTEANNITRANSYFVNLLSSTNDPRLFRFFKVPQTGGSAIVGTVYGQASGNLAGNASSGIGPGLATSPTQAQWIYPSFESMFLEAEAIARGWLPGTPKTAYEAAVTESFVWLGVPSATTAAATYLTNTAIANWSNAGSTVASQVKFIVYQKYIAMAGIDPLEAWSDQRRLNFLPNNGYISVAPSKISNTLPVRLPYPQSEYTTNGANVSAEGTINIFTSKLFWQP